jgi:hypothetical protein
MPFHLLRVTPIREIGELNSSSTIVPSFQTHGRHVSTLGIVRFPAYQSRVRGLTRAGALAGADGYLNCASSLSMAASFFLFDADGAGLWPSLFARALPAPWLALLRAP